MRTALCLALTLVGLASCTVLEPVREREPLLRKRNVFDEYYNKGSSVSRLRTDPSSSTFRIEVDDEEINEIIEDFKEFGGKYISRTKGERIALMNKLKEAFRNTAAKLILNFGKTIPPLVNSWAQVMKHVQVNEKCDQNCAVKCLDPLAGCDSMYFNEHCLSSCNCRFDIEDVEPKLLRTKIDEITSNLGNVNRFFKDVNMENMKLLKPSFDAYMSKASELHEEFGELLLEHGAKVFGCDEECLEDCLNPQFVSYWEMPMCVKHCKCKFELIKIDKISGPREGILGNIGTHHKRGISLFGNIKEDIEEEEEEDEEELLRNPIRTKVIEKRYPGLREEEVMSTGGVLRKRHHDRDEFNIPELMKYSEYDPKAWAFFKRFRDDI